MSGVRAEERRAGKTASNLQPHPSKAREEIESEIEREIKEMGQMAIEDVGSTILELQPRKAKVKVGDKPPSAPKILIKIEPKPPQPLLKEPDFGSPESIDQYLTTIDTGDDPEKIPKPKVLRTFKFGGPADQGQSDLFQAIMKTQPKFQPKSQPTIDLSRGVKPVVEKGIPKPSLSDVVSGRFPVASADELKPFFT
jgi:hypothetical protein